MAVIGGYNQICDGMRIGKLAGVSGAYAANEIVSRLTRIGRIFQGGAKLGGTNPRLKEYLPGPETGLARGNRDGGNGGYCREKPNIGRLHTADTRAICTFGRRGATVIKLAPIRGDQGYKDRRTQTGLWRTGQKKRSQKWLSNFQAFWARRRGVRRGWLLSEAGIFSKVEAGHRRRREVFRLRSPLSVVV